MTSEARLGPDGPPVTIQASTRARRISLRLDNRGRRVILVVPPRVSQRRALEWAVTQRRWVEARLAGLNDAAPLGAGSTIPWRGTDHAVYWAADLPRTPDIAGGTIRLGGPAETIGPRLSRWMKARARDLLSAETAEFAAMIGVRVSAVGVGDPASRWGSCSSSGGIRYSWRLILAPDFVRRATVAHEVAHRVHMHHGPEFHALVRDMVGRDAARARSWLRTHGASLHRFVV